MRSVLILYYMKVQSPVLRQLACHLSLDQINDPHNCILPVKLCGIHVKFAQASIDEERNDSCMCTITECPH